MPVGQAAGAPLAARELPALLRRVHEALAERRAAIDDLNVFPVPDGDTGTNLTLTVRAGLDALHDARPAPADALATAVIRGAVRGARGNSGVIISQVLRAVVEVVTGYAQVDAALYASALGRARDLAYEAVADPVEGTILTVLREAAAAAEAAVADGVDLVAASARTCAATAEAVERTREQLDVLREAGVVDAGARGFEVVLAAVHGHLTGEAPPVVRDAPRRRPLADAACLAAATAPFEVQYLLDAPDVAAAALRRTLEQLGDSVVVVAADGLLNVHVHTADVGAAIEAGLAHGRPSSIEVVHFGDQIAAHDAARAHPRVGVVAVLDGAGLAGLARRHGAVVVPGGPGELPSVADLLDGIRQAGSGHVLLLPGHRNVVATAVAAAEVEQLERGTTVTVVGEAAAPTSVLAALAVLGSDSAPEQALRDAVAAAGAVATGEVVAAVRDADTPAGPVVAGQPLAVVDGAVVAAREDVLAALGALCDALPLADAELVTLLVGQDGEEHRDAAWALVAGRTEAELEVLDAGSRRTAFCLGVE